MDSYIARSSKQVGAALRSLRKQAKLTQTEPEPEVLYRRMDGLSSFYYSETEHKQMSESTQALFERVLVLPDITKLEKL
tara:strand:+ start:2676 stop:2912 length:237 start_codon:yes stop_codon:yes gene_type:complete